jgi:hypothetical protein
MTFTSGLHCLLLPLPDRPSRVDPPGPSAPVRWPDGLGKTCALVIQESQAREQTTLALSTVR